MNIGENIKKLRKEKGLTQKRLSELSGVHEVQIARYENGKSKPSVEILKKICEALEQPYILFMDYESGKKELSKNFDKLNKIHDTIKKENDIFDIVNRINLLGHCLVESTSEDEEKELDFYFLFNKGNIPITTDELQEIQKEIDLYLEYLVQKFIKSKPLQNENEDYSQLVNQSRKD